MLNFGTLGAADITPQALVYPCINEPRATIRAIAARDQARAKGFALHHHIPDVLDSYDAVIAHEHCNVIYNPLPISAHHEWTIKALQAGKHVLCEKSLACNAAEAEEMTAVAEEKGLILMDAFHYRYHPLFAKAREIYASGTLGKIKTISAAFAINGSPPDSDIRMNFATAGGVTMDIGCYPISWLRHLTDLEPVVEAAHAITGPPNVDLMLEAELSLGDIAAKITGDMRPGGQFKAELQVVGDVGTMTVFNPLAPHMGHAIQVQIGDNKDTFTVDRRTTYCYQLDAFIEAVKTGQPPITDGNDAVKQMRVIDRCYELAGLPQRGT